MAFLSKTFQLALVVAGFCSSVSAQPISTNTLRISIKASNGLCLANTLCELDVTVHNTDAKKPMTVLTWSNPLDSLAERLGIFEVRDSTGKVVDLNYITVRRATPPPSSDLVEIAPNGSANVKVVLERLSKSELPAGTKYTVTAKGWWEAIWDETKQQVIATHLQDMSGAASGSFASNSVQVTKA